MGRIPKKIKILKFIVEQGVATLDDITDHLGSQNHTNSIRVSLYQLGISHIKYGEIPHGVWCACNPSPAKLLKTYFKDLPEIYIRKIHPHYIPHSLGLNRIRIILSQIDYFKIDTWWSENYIRSLSPRMRFGISLARIPDAIFWRLRGDGSRQKFFLEYERTLKSKSRYVNIFQYYANRKDVLNKNVLYICGTETILEELKKIEEFLVKSGKLEACGLYFQFITFDSLCQQYISQTKKQKEKTKCLN